MTARPGPILGKRVGGEPADAADHFYACTACGELVDMRDLGQVLAHDGPGPCPAASRAPRIGPAFQAVVRKN